jgi:hypothetical protein
MKDDMPRLIQQMVEQELARLQGGTSPNGNNEFEGIHFTQLAPDESNEPLAR